MKTQSTEGAKHFSEICKIAIELTADIKDELTRKDKAARLTGELLVYQSNRPAITVTIY